MVMEILYSSGLRIKDLRDAEILDYQILPHNKLQLTIRSPTFKAEVTTKTKIPLFLRMKGDWGLEDLKDYIRTECDNLIQKSTGDAP